MSKKRAHGQGRTRDRGKSWNHEYRSQSKTLSKTQYPTKRAAEEEFTKWRQKLDAKEASGPVTTVGYLLDKFVALQFREGLAGASIVKHVVDRRLMPKLKNYDARLIGLADVETYIEERKLEKTYKGTLTRNATINNEISYLKSALKLLRPEPRYLKIAKLNTKDGVRKGLVSVEEYHRLLQALEGYQKPVWCFSYYTGVRQGQLFKLRREWGLEALETGILEVPGWHGAMRITKNGEPHHIPVYNSAMREFLKWALSTGDPACPFLFQRDGKRITKDAFYWSFKRIERGLKMAHIHFHDLRRTAVTNMIEAGIPPDEAMAVSGHLDPSVFKRYHIMDSIQKKAAVTKVGERMAAWHNDKLASNSDKIRTGNSDVLEANFGEASKPS